MARVLTKKSTVPGKVPLAADLEIGELAVNTADAKLYTKHSDNTIKQLGGDAASGYFRTEPITATASGQTSFTVPGGYTPGAIFVSLNGATLPPADFTATNGTTVVLASGSGIVAGSVLLVHVLSAFEVADALPLGGTAADSSKLGGRAAADYEALYGRAGTAGALGFRNKIINGDMRINQRGFNGIWTGLPEGAYGFGRWKRSGTNIQQVIEEGNFKPNTVHTLSGTGVTPQQITSPASGHWTITVPNMATNVQVEEGTVVTPFEHRPIGLEISLCQRYFAVVSGLAYEANTLVGYSFPTAMRATPTVTLSVGSLISLTFTGFHALNAVRSGLSYIADAEL